LPTELSKNTWVEDGEGGRPGTMGIKVKLGVKRVTVRVPCRGQKMGGQSQTRESRGVTEKHEVPFSRERTGDEKQGGFHPFQ